MRFYILTLLCLMANILHAQITIGTGEPAAKGALLQLKNRDGITDGSANADKGLILPRIALTDLNSLNDIDGITTTTDPLKYVGMIIYNPIQYTNNCMSIATGTYVWDGDQWNLLAGTGSKEANSTIEDLECLQQILDDNPYNTLGWNIDLSNIDNPDNYNLLGVEWTETSCGKRVTKIIMEDDGFGPMNYGLDQLNLSNLTMLKFIDISYQDISTVILPATSALTYFRCTPGKLNALDVTKNPELETLDIASNHLTELDVTKNPKLSYLGCSNNMLPKLDLTQSTSLKYLYCEYNKITELNLQNCKQLVDLYCSANTLEKPLIITENKELTRLSASLINIETLDLTQNTKLKILNCSDNSKLTEIDLSQNILLNSFTCQNSNLQNLDVSKNVALTTLNCLYNPLTSLDLTNNKSINNLQCNNTLPNNSVKVCKDTWDTWSTSISIVSPQKDSAIYDKINCQ